MFWLYHRTCNKCINSSHPSILICKRERIIGFLPYRVIMRIDDIMYAKCLENYMAHNKHSAVLAMVLAVFIYFKNILFICRERGREGEREGEKNPWVVARPLVGAPPGQQPRPVP